MTVSFLLTPEHEQLKAAARGFAREQSRDLAAATRAEPDPRTRALLLRPVFENAVAAGSLKGLVPAPFGGGASSGADAAIFLEEWASGDAGLRHLRRTAGGHGLQRTRGSANFDADGPARGRAPPRSSTATPG